MNPFVQLGLVFILATALGVVVRFFKQPLILAYILTGLILSALGISKFLGPESLSLFSQFGIAFLLFMVGLELKITDLKQIGKVAAFVGFGQIIITFFGGLFLSLALGFSFVSSVYISLALTFSSTIIVVKLLSEKNDLSSLYGKIVVGLLLAQDFVVILILMFLSGFSNQASFSPFLLIFIKGLAFFLFVSLLIRKFIPFVFSHLAKNQELLFLTAVTWCFIFAAISQFLGFSLEIGAFLAGISLSSLPYHYQISSRIRPLRDLFVTLFFVGLGMQMVFAPSFNFVLPVLILSLFVLLGKPLVVLLLMSISGYRKRTSFMTSISLAQISEFSLILAALGLRLGHIGAYESALITGVGIVTITSSNYLILRGNKLYQLIGSRLNRMERENSSEKRPILAKAPSDHVVLIGCSRTGGDILELLRKKEEPYLVLDFNPEVIRWLEAQDVPCVFGDAGDEEILDQLNVDKAKVIISTNPNLDDNLTLITRAKVKNSKAPILVTANFPEEEEELYKAGADYVILPHLLGGKHLAHILSEHSDHLEDYLSSKRKQNGSTS